jgi:hypothetical protein
MIEAYAFFSVFTVQILAISVLQPVWFTKYVRVRAMTFPAEQFAQLYPGVDRIMNLERFLTLYRMLNIGITVLGVLVMGWLFSYMQRPDWDNGPVDMVVCAYFMTQMLVPVSLIVWVGVKYGKVVRHSLATKRVAVLERRGLFDFVSPFVVFLAGVCYVLFAALVVYIQQRPFPGFAGYINIVCITLVYAANAFGVYTLLYGKKKNPLETHEDRVRVIGVGVKGCVYSCIVCVVFMSLNFTLALFGLHQWKPFALSVFFVMIAFLSFLRLVAPLRQPVADGLRSSPVG